MPAPEDEVRKKVESLEAAEKSHNRHGARRRLAAKQLRPGQDDRAEEDPERERMRKIAYGEKLRRYRDTLIHSAWNDSRIAFKKGQRLHVDLLPDQIAELRARNVDAEKGSYRAAICDLLTNMAGEMSDEELEAETPEIYIPLHRAMVNLLEREDGWEGERGPDPGITKAVDDLIEPFKAGKLPRWYAYASSDNSYRDGALSDLYSLKEAQIGEDAELRLEALERLQAIYEEADALDIKLPRSRKGLSLEAKGVRKLKAGEEPDWK